MDDVDYDIHTSLHHVDHHKPQKLSVGDASVSSAEPHRHPHFERRIAVSSVETRGLSVTQSEAGMPGVEAVAGGRSVSILHSLPLSVDLDQGRRLGTRGVHTQCPHWHWHDMFHPVLLCYVVPSCILYILYLYLYPQNFLYPCSNAHNSGLE